jgi:hypothetical protein
MYNVKQKNDFIESTYSHQDDVSIENVIRFWCTVGVTERQNQKDFIDFTLKEVIMLFEVNEWIKANTFTHHKSLLKQYVEWCISLNKLSVDIHPIMRLERKDIKGIIKYDRQYVSNFSDMKDAIEYVYDNTDVIDNSQFMYPKLLFCLSWLGFNKEEVRFIKKEHVDLERKMIRSPLDNSYVVDDVEDYIIKLIEDCIELKEITTKNRYSELQYKMQSSEYLLRAKSSKQSPDNTPVPETFINNSNSRFMTFSRKLDPSDKYYNKGFTCDSIYWSGAYYRLYEKSKRMEIKQSDYETLSKVSRIDVNNALSLGYFWHDFRAWREYFYGV